MAAFNYSRVDVARRRRGMTKSALAEATGVTTKSLFNYSRGEQEPTKLVIERLANAVGFPSAFFYGDTLDEPPIDGSSFRALSTLTARQRAQALGSGTLALYLSHWIEQRFDLPAPNVPNYTGLEPEIAAEAVRDAWGLTQRPVSNIVHLLEAHGVRVFSLAQEAREVDAFSFWHGDTPYVFLNTKKTPEHSRMDAAHELGHLVMHRHGGPRGREAENEAQAFGSAFLMPAPSILAEVPSGAKLGQLVKVKRKWKVSAWNLAHRAHKLDILSDWQYRSICIALSKRGKANEPSPMKSWETSQVLDKVFKALRAQSMTKASVGRELDLPPDEINTYVFGLVLTPLASSGPAEPAEPRERPALRVV